MRVAGGKMTLAKFPMLMLDQQRDNIAFLAFLKNNGITPVRSDLLTQQHGPCSIVLHEADAIKVRKWMKANSVPFTEIPIMVEQG